MRRARLAKRETRRRKAIREQVKSKDLGVAGLRFDDRPRAEQITITVNGRLVDCCVGETVATALLAAGYRRLRVSPRTKAPRGAFCMMGVCQECVLRIDGRKQQSCLVAVRPGLLVEIEPKP